ncbi:unnamed protein product [Penicillium salamii]|uniref:Uncharacterized protein n=1 Tax=Penicillium salamii TaxID=1612424 RepID=A0A9W4ITM3_9EURO|nr:unnamed protein product [Penicillium salamii]CAG7995669.1 unnamed protein product [Penicillium salamii]CAG8164757.1 unnamed protein product [Penicillium salamii]CAG8193192.1 unnamed protein product [Penicillium salamii]CAG8226410.1 unnamed protein product [Penicillium salamii]
MTSALRSRAFGLSRNSWATSSTLNATRQCRSSAARSYSTSDRLPKIADTSVWTAMIPKFIRNRGAHKDPKKEKSKEWNPATFYIIMFTLIGSQAIRMITLKNSYAAYTRTTDAKIELLREVISRVKNGEQVDVEKLLGTGDEAKEREWDEVLREIEAEDSLWHQKKTSQREAEEAQAPVKEEKQKQPTQPSSEDSGPVKTETTKKMRFY